MDTQTLILSVAGVSVVFIIISYVVRLAETIWKSFLQKTWLIVFLVFCAWVIHTMENSMWDEITRWGITLGRMFL